MDLAELKAEIAKIPEGAPTLPLWNAVAELLSSQAETILGVSSRQAGLAASLSAPDPDSAESEHPVGLCQDTTCEVCVTQAQQLIELGREALSEEVDEALTLVGGEQFRVRVAQAVQTGQALKAQRSQKVAITA